ncbi:MAG TPA: hypothetical protein VII12_20535 [Thermoanaerobaculia bacterium]
MARREKSTRKKKPSIARGKSAVSRTAKKVNKRLRTAKRAEEEHAPATPKLRKSGNGKVRRPRVQPDIPLEVLERTYTPKQTSLKAPFRTSGEEHQRDQEFAQGYADERWRDEDRFTNKSGDPRIGTHHRKYEPNE